MCTHLRNEALSNPLKRMSGFHKDKQLLNFIFRYQSVENMYNPYNSKLSHESLTHQADPEIYFGETNQVPIRKLSDKIESIWA